MDPFGLPTSSQYETITYYGNSMTNGGNWYTWTKPLNKSMVSILVIAAGGGGGQGVVGANSTAAGGGGGGSGAMTVVNMPLAQLPPRLYISVGHATTTSGLSSYVSVQPNTTANHIVATAGGGGVGGSASGATAGAGGTAGGVAIASVMPLGWIYTTLALAGQAGVAGGTTTNGNTLGPATTGLRVMGGTGGGGLPAAGTNGSIGGSFVIPTSSFYLAQSGGAATVSATVPPGNGLHGFRLDDAAGDNFYYGGTGAASTFGSATGAGLVQGIGGNGGIGSGGGGNGGALTGSTPAPLPYGGSGLVRLSCY